MTLLSAVEILKLVCKGLEDRNIQYMVSGSYALGMYVRMRTTRDIDIVVNLKEEDLNSFFEMFNEDFHINRQAILTEVKRKGMFNIMNEISGYKIDFIVRKNDEYRQIEFERRKRKTMFDIEVWVVSAEDLLLSKLIWIQELQSGIQIRDIQSLLKESEDTLDMDYIKTWIKKLHLNTFNLI